MQRNFTKLLFSLLIFWSTNPLVTAQTSFSDNFDSYTAGDFLCVSNNKWKTWDNKPGTATDTKIANDKSFSGSNSMKIFATNANGGPTDILLPFGGRYDKGTFIIEWKMFIENGKTAYFNLQGNESPGILWSMEAFFTADKILNLTNNSNSNLLISTSFPTDEWFTFKLDINLTDNEWKLKINDICIGSFVNSSKFIASANFYPSNASSVYYIDDISFDYVPTVTRLSNNIGISNLIWDQSRIAGEDLPLTFTLSNLGNENILSANLNGTLNGNPMQIELETVELAPGERQVMVTTNKIQLEEGNNIIEINVEDVNGISDEDECNNFTSLSIKANKRAENKNVLVEEATGTWCQWCPRGAVYLDLLSHRYPGIYIPVAVHNNDPMAVQAYDALIQSVPGFGGWPNVAINRSLIIDPDASEEPFIENISIPAPAYFVSGAKFDESTRRLDVSVTTVFQEDTNTPMWVNLVLTEDGVRGTGNGYNQVNIYAGGSRGVMGGYELLPNPVPASIMVYDHVGRFLTGVQKSNENSLDGPYTNGQSVVRNFSFTIPASMNIDNFNIVPILLGASGYQNAAITTIEDALANGFIVSSEDVLVSESFQAYPNPTTDAFFVDFQVKKTSDVTVEMTDVAGKLIQRQVHHQMNGAYTLPIQTQGWTPGMYFVTVRSQEQTITKKIFVTK